MGAASAWFSGLGTAAKVGVTCGGIGAVIAVGFGLYKLY